MMDFLTSLIVGTPYGIPEAAQSQGLDGAITALLDHFRDEHVPVALSLAIVAAAAALLALLVVWSVVAWVRIGRLRRQIRSCGRGSPFRENYVLVDGWLAASLFAGAWSEYRSCLRLAEDRVLYPRRPDEYLGLHSIPSRCYPARLFAAAHGYFIGVGLLLTFVGLVAALKFAAGGVASADLGVAKDALNALLAAASFKFMTSIAGLGSSLVLSIAARTASYAVEGAAHGLAADLERAMAPIVVECVAFDQLEATRAQTRTLNEIGANLATQAMPETFPAAAASAGDAERNAALHEMLSQFVTEFRAEFRGAASGEMKQMTQRLSAVGDAIGSMQSHIGRSGEAFAGQLGLAAQRLLEAATKLQQSLDGRVDAMASRFAEGEKLVSRAAESAATGLVSGFSQFDQSLRAQLGSMREIVGSLDRARHSLDASAASWSASAAPVLASVDASRAITAELSEIAGRVGTTQRDMAEMAKAVAQLTDKVGAVWTNYSDRFEQVDDDLTKAFAQLQGGTRAFGDEFMKFVAKLDNSLASGMQAFSVGTEELREVVQLLVDKNGKLTAKAA
jgi:hypothetical protein